MGMSGADSGGGRVSVSRVGSKRRSMVAANAPPTSLELKLAWDLGEGARGTVFEKVLG